MSTNFPLPSVWPLWNSAGNFSAPMISYRPSSRLVALLLATVSLPALAHETGTPHPEVTAATPLSFAVESKGPLRAPKEIVAAGTATTGQGFWKFAAARDLTPVPPEALPKLKGAHGTLIVDPTTDTVYWGLENVGWIGFSNKLSASWIVQGDPTFAKGNLHGADIWPRKGKAPLVAAADNNEGHVYLTDTTFQKAETLGIPPVEPYADKKGWAPTDVAFTGAKDLFVTDGYGKAYFLPAKTTSLGYTGKFYGGKKISNTPHGITYDKRDKSLLVSARPEGEIKRWDRQHEHFSEIGGLPKGSTVCDVDVWGDYALAPCLNGPDGKPGPIYIVNLKTRSIVSTLKPKEELGYATAQHIHDACWYVTGKGAKREVYVVFTPWNPGDVGAMKLVSARE